MLILDASAVETALPMAAAIDAMAQAFRALAEGRVDQPLRHQLDRPEDHGVALVMPCSVRGDGAALTVKVVNLFDNNPAQGLPRIQGAVMVFNPHTGACDAVLDGAALTALRTGATSGLATALLARQDAAVVSLFGAGVQGRRQLEAVCEVRDIQVGLICDPMPAAAAALVDDLAGNGRIPTDLRVVDARTAAAEADILCTATISPTPVFDDADLKVGCHINAIGSYQPEVQELPAATVARALVVLDSASAAWEESGDLIQAARLGVIDHGHHHAELGPLLLQEAPGRTSAQQITVFKSVGLAVQDAAAASAALRGAGRNS